MEASEARVERAAGGAAGGRRLLGAPALFACAGAVLVAGLLLGFWYAPVDASSMGFSQKIL